MHDCPVSSNIDLATVYEQSGYTNEQLDNNYMPQRWLFCSLVTFRSKLQCKVIVITWCESAKSQKQLIIAQLVFFKATLFGFANIAQYKSSSHNTLLPLGYFVQEVMWGDSNETYLN